MLLRVENLGPLREAEVDLSKRLIVLTGPNNTGKTYLAWSVYGLFRSHFSSRIELVEEWTEELLSFPAYELNLDEKLSLNRDVLLSAIASSYEQDLHLCFAAGRESFKGVRLSLVEGQGPLEHDKELGLKKQGLIFAAKSGQTWGLVATGSSPLHLRFALTDSSQPEDVFHTLRGLGDVEVEGQTKSHVEQMAPGELERTKRLLRREIISALTHKLFGTCSLFPAERIAINIFAKELALTRSKLVDEIVDMDREEDAKTQLESIKQRVGRYPWPIRDSLATANDLTQLSKQRAPFRPLADELERSVLGGHVHTSEHGEMMFSPLTSPERHLHMHLTASVVKSLSSLVFYFRHLADEGDFIIIDEPELNLHPDGQRHVARVLAKAVNQGLRVMISTHSDYIIRELNNLIMLSKVPKSEAQSLGFEPEWALAPKKVGVYLFEGGTARAVPVEETGFSVSTIDEVTNKLNADTQRLYARLYDEG
ncbi:MAG: AAA family ATPase [Polyangiaceae bacterium]|jgi:hypothetical protein|nr:AAA family ATPase [Polyangiaceae bacterium]